MKRLDTSEGIVYIESRTDLLKGLVGVTRLMFRRRRLPLRVDFDSAGYGEDVAIAILAHELQPPWRSQRPHEIVDAESTARSTHGLVSASALRPPLGVTTPKKPAGLAKSSWASFRGVAHLENELTPPPGRLGVP